MREWVIGAIVLIVLGGTLRLMEYFRIDVGDFFMSLLGAVVLIRMFVAIPSCVGYLILN